MDVRARTQPSARVRCVKTTGSRPTSITSSMARRFRWPRAAGDRPCFLQYSCLCAVYATSLRHRDVSNLASVLLCSRRRAPPRLLARSLTRPLGPGRWCVVPLRLRTTSVRGERRPEMPPGRTGGGWRSLCTYLNLLEMGFEPGRVANVTTRTHTHSPTAPPFGRQLGVIRLPSAGFGREGENSCRYRFGCLEQLASPWPFSFRKQPPPYRIRAVFSTVRSIYFYLFAKLKVR